MVLMGLKERILWALDSLPHDGDALYGLRAEVETVARFLHDLAKIRSLNIDVWRWVQLAMPGIPTQPDSWNCGVYVLMFAE